MSFLTGIMGSQTMAGVAATAATGAVADSMIVQAIETTADPGEAHTPVVEISSGPGTGSSGLLTRPPREQHAHFAQRPDKLVEDHLGAYLVARPDYLGFALERAGVGREVLPGGVTTLEELARYVEERFLDALKQAEGCLDEVSVREWWVGLAAGAVVGLAGALALVGLAGALASVGVGVLAIAGVLVGEGALAAEGKISRVAYSSSYGFYLAGSLAGLKIAEIGMFTHMGNISIAGMALAASALAFFAPLPKALVKTVGERRAFSSAREQWLQVLAQGRSEATQREFLPQRPGVVVDFLKESLPAAVQEEIDTIRAERDRLAGLRSNLEADLVRLPEIYTDPAQRALQEAQTKAAIETLEQAIATIDSRSLQPMEGFRNAIPAMLEQWVQAQAGLQRELATTQQRQAHQGRLAAVSGQIAQAQAVESEAADRIAELLGDLQTQLADIGAARAVLVEVETGVRQNVQSSV